MFRLGDRIIKVRGQFNIGARGIVNTIDFGHDDGYDIEIKCTTAIAYTTNGKQFRQTFGRLWIRSHEWDLDPYDGTDPSHWQWCCWRPTTGFVKK